MFDKIKAKFVGPNIGAPQPVAVNVNTPFKNYNVIVQPGVPAPTGGSPEATILQHLAQIEQFPCGLALFQGIQATGKQVGIKYLGPNNNQAAGAARGYYVLRMKHDATDRLGFGQELTATIQRMTQAGQTMNWLADELYRVAIPTWNGGTMLSPFRTAPLVRVPNAQGGRPVPQLPTVGIIAKVNNFLANTIVPTPANAALPSNDEMDALVIVLEPWMQPGLGCASRINYDPHKTMVAGQNRPPHVGLYHELTHAYYNACGRQLGREDSMNEANGGRLFEAEAVGLGIFASRPISENKFRAAIGVTLRQNYP